MSNNKELIVRAIRTRQGNNSDVFAFFLHGSDIQHIADISRVVREEGELRGFQRKEIRTHVNAIIEFLDSGPKIFPNAIILALSPEVVFKGARGPKPDGLIEVGDAGTLSIPIRKEGSRSAWIVDGQQRSLALSRAENNQIPVPVIGFVSEDIETHREQFILVNKAKPLPTRLINELLPEVGVVLPRDLAARRLPSELCNILNRQPNSPFYKLIRRESDSPDSPAILTDTAVIAAVKKNLRPPMGALSQYRGTGSNSSDVEAMYDALVLFWSTVRDVFPKAWGLPPTESRLMHSAGIRAMGALMDPIMLRADSSPSPKDEVQKSLTRIAPSCRWTDGEWDELGWSWNEVQSTSQHISRLSDYLIRLDRTLARQTQ